MIWLDLVHKMSHFNAAILNPVQVVLLWILVWLPFGLPMAIRFRWLPGRRLDPPQKLTLLLPLYGLFPPVFLWWLSQHSGSLGEYGVTLSPHFFYAGFWGLGLGLGSFIGLFCLQVYAGWVTVKPKVEIPPLLAPASQSEQTSSIDSSLNLESWFCILSGLLGLSLGISLVEEWLFRGFLWTELQTILPMGQAAVWGSLVFSVVHLIWEGWEGRSQLVGLGLMGGVLCVARWVDDGGLGIAWGLHAGWIWAVASLDLLFVHDHSSTAPVAWIGKLNAPLSGMMSWLCLVGTGGVLIGWAYVSGTR